MVKSQAAEDALVELREGLSNDGADLVLERADDDEVVVRLVFTDETCMDCIVAPPMLKMLVADNLESKGVTAPVTLVDPREA